MKKGTRRSKRKTRIRKKLYGTSKRPRVSVFRSNRYIYVQVIDDDKQRTIVGLSEKKLSSKDRSGTKIDRANKLGKNLADLLKKKKISQVVFDRSGYKYHGRIKAVAEGLREVGIEL